MIQLCLVVLQQEMPLWSSAEALARKQLPAIGGRIDWVNESGKWELSLDVDNKNREFDCRSIKDLDRLYALRVFHGTIKETSIVELKKLPRLGLIVLLCNELSDEAVIQISFCKSVTKLDLKAGRLKPGTLASIGRMPNLQRLFLYNTKITDQDLRPFRLMTHLQDLTLPKSVSEQGVGQVQSWLPKARVTRI